LYVATTYDGGQTWSTVDATPNDPVQKGSICTGGTTCGQDRNLLDFIDSTVDQQGRVLVAFADGCTGACASGGAQNFDALATIARQAGGRTLFAASDPKPNLTVTAVSASVSRSGKSTVSSTVRNTGVAAAPETVLQVQDGSALVGTAVVPALAPGESATLTVKWGTKNLHGTQTLVATADATGLVAESDEQDNTRSTTVTLP
ncbi:MAG: CARDB domain-containing protein, partial [Motilibacteraceae bacterium]